MIEFALNRNGDEKMKDVVCIDGVEYVPKKESICDMQYVIVRTYSAGVFAGYLKSRAGKEVVLNNARRLWYWDGAASLSQLAMEGTKAPENCKFPIDVDEVLLTEAIEILTVTPSAKKSIAEVPVWKK
jgi:hypothetical protein